MSTVWQAHADFQAKRYPDDERCVGQLRIVDRGKDEPIWNIACDTCQYTAGIPAAQIDMRFRLQLRSELAGFPKLYAGKRFEEDANNAPTMRAIREWIADFRRNPAPAPAVYGHQGRGKSHLLVATCEQIIARYNVSVWFRSSSGLLDDLQQAFGDQQAHKSIWNRAVTVDVLALDDIGAEQASDWRGDRLARLVDERYLSERPILLASNYPPSGWEAMLGARTVSRLQTMTFPLELVGMDRRVAA